MNDWIDRRTTVKHMHTDDQHVFLIYCILVWGVTGHSSSFLCSCTVCHAAWMHRGCNFTCDLNVTFTIQSCQDALSNSSVCIRIGLYWQIHQIRKTSAGISGIGDQLSFWTQSSNNVHASVAKERAGLAGLCLWFRGWDFKDQIVEKLQGNAIYIQPIFVEDNHVVYSLNPPFGAPSSPN